MRRCAGVLVCVLLDLTGCGGGSSSSGSTSTQVAQPPVANAGGPYVGTTTAAVTFSGAASADPQGQALMYVWNFGDGGTGTGVKPTYTYATAGAYAVTLSVTNTSNLGSASTSQAIIALAAPGSTDGVVYDGLRPLVGAHVYLLAANTTGYGQASVSLLSAAATGHADAVGAYVVSGSDGGFQWVGNRSCTPGTQLYVYATGGGNAATGLMAALGNCPASGSYSGFSYVWVNEVSTVASAYSFAGFATDETHVSSSGTALAQIGIANAFANTATHFDAGRSSICGDSSGKRVGAAARDQHAGEYSGGVREQQWTDVQCVCGVIREFGIERRYGNCGDRYCASSGGQCGCTLRDSSGGDAVFAGAPRCAE